MKATNKVNRGVSIQNAYGLRYPVYIFQSETLAFQATDHCHKPMRVMLGDAPQFWVVCPRDAAVLEAAGYEHALR